VSPGEPQVAAVLVRPYPGRFKNATDPSIPEKDSYSRAEQHAGEAPVLTPPKPIDENRRLAALRGSGILDTPAEERFDRITRIARRVFDVPIALVSLVDEHRQWFKSSQGLDAQETPRDISFCGHAILSPDVLVIQDARDDQRFRDNPLVTGPPNIRFYAGCPLALSNGELIGTLCIIDRVPRTLEGQDQAILRDLAKVVERELAAVELAIMDELTKLCNRRGFEHRCSQSLEMCRRLGEPSLLLYFDLDGFKRINDSFGHFEGDRALQEFALALTKTFRASDVLGRIGGDEFAVLVTSVPADRTELLIRRLEQMLEGRELSNGRDYEIRFSVGAVAFDPARHRDVGELMKEADELMYQKKKKDRSAGPYRFR
jgi:diguanylate cyclase (GGDEF)-like protein